MAAGTPFILIYTSILDPWWITLQNIVSLSQNAKDFFSQLCRRPHMQPFTFAELFFFSICSPHQFSQLNDNFVNYRLEIGRGIKCTWYYLKQTQKSKWKELSEMGGLALLLCTSGTWVPLSARVCVCTCGVCMFSLCRYGIFSGYTSPPPPHTYCTHAVLKTWCANWSWQFTHRGVSENEWCALQWVGTLFWAVLYHVPIGSRPLQLWMGQVVSENGWMGSSL